MKYILIGIGFFALLSGFGILASAKSAIHEIEAFILFLISSVLISSSSIIIAIEKKNEIVNNEKTNF